MLPYRSVTPSAALTQNVSGSFQPVFFRRGQVGLLQVHDLAALLVEHVANGRAIDARAVVDDVLLRRRQERRWLAPRRCRDESSRCRSGRAGQAGAVELHAVEVLVVDVLARLAGVADEVEQPVLGVDLDDPAGPPGPAGDRRSSACRRGRRGRSGPSRSAPTTRSSRRFPRRSGRRLVVRGTRRRTLGDQALRLAGLGVQRAELEVPLEPVAADEAQLVAGLVPVDVRCSARPSTSA